MGITKIEDEIVEFATLGGGLLGGGGGGEIEEGRQIGKMAVRIGSPTIVDINSLSDDATLVTVSAVGAPAAEEQCLKPMDYVKAIEILKSTGVRVDGLITSENGGLATVNGWFQSAFLNIPVVDAPCNGRAHPTGLMGSIGLHKIKDYFSQQVAVGGDPKRGKHLEVYAGGSLKETSRIIRETAISAGGLVAVARNPIKVSYAKKHIAVGGVSQAIKLGEEMLKAKATGSEEMIGQAMKFLGGKKIAEGIVKAIRLETKGGFDQGWIKIAGKEEYELAFWNEYMTLESKGKRIGTFPDLIATIDLKEGIPLTTMQIKKGDEAGICLVPKERLRLGSGMKDPKLFKPIKEMIKKPVISYVFRREYEVTHAKASFRDI
jgi:hypothetical protein